MTKILNLIILILLQSSNSYTSAVINCTYDFYYHDVVKSIYQCEITKDFVLYSKDEAIFSAASQDHYHRKSNDDVLGIVMSTKYIKYFPSGLEKIFENLILIHAPNNFIQEIGQNDLKVFPKIKFLNFRKNEIKILESGLFEYNPNLVYITFANNKIFFIHPEVFDGLINLEYLYLNSNKCIDKGSYKSRSEVLNVIEFVKNDCLGTEFKEVEKKLDKIEHESDNLQPKDLKDKIGTFEAEFNRSSFANFTSLRERLDRLKVAIPEEIINLVPNENAVDEKSSGFLYKIKQLALLFLDQ